MPEGFSVWIYREHWDQMLADVSACAPLEACGLVSGRARRSWEVFPVENELQSPSEFRMNPIEQVRVLLHIDESDLELLAIYHSHPEGPAYPSPTDLARAAYPEAAYLIWSPFGLTWHCKGYLIRNGQIQKITIHILEDDAPEVRQN